MPHAVLVVLVERAHVAFPAELLESTVRENYDRAFGWLTPLRPRLSAFGTRVASFFANPWVAAISTVAVASLILSFSDPGFGFTGASLRLLLGIFLSMIAINIGLSAITMAIARRRFDVRGALESMPAALLLAAVSVLVSRLAGISPGFLFGLVISVAYARELRLRFEAQLALTGIGLTVVAGVLAWVGYSAVSAADGHGFWYYLLQESLAATVLEALGTMVVALLPLEFLDGKLLWRWSKVGWAITYAIVFVVFLIVVVPMSGNWGQMSAPVFGWGTLFLAFAVLAVGVWAAFRFIRPRGGATTSSPEAEEQQPSLPRR